MADIIDVFREFASSQTGQITLAVAGIVILLLAIPLLWKALKALFKAAMWGLLIVVVVVVVGAAVWFWMKHKTDNREKMEAIEAEAMTAVRSGWTNISERIPTGNTNEPLEENESEEDESE